MGVHEMCFKLGVERTVGSLELEEMCKGLSLLLVAQSLLAFDYL